MAQQYPVLLMDTQQVADTFEGAFARLGACHSIYDQCFVTDDKCAEIGNSNMMSQWISINYVIFFTDKAIVCFMDYFRTNFLNENISPKMHLLEDHTVEWVRRYNFGFGMLGEQGAESIHRRFNELNTTYSSIRNKEKRLLCVVKEVFRQTQSVLSHYPQREQNTLLQYSGYTHLHSLHAFSTLNSVKRSLHPTGKHLTIFARYF